MAVETVPIENPVENAPPPADNAALGQTSEAPVENAGILGDLIEDTHSPPDTDSASSSQEEPLSQESTPDVAGEKPVEEPEENHEAPKSAEESDVERLANFLLAKKFKQTMGQDTPEAKDLESLFALQVRTTETRKYKDANVLVNEGDGTRGIYTRVNGEPIIVLAIEGDGPNSFTCTVKSPGETNGDEPGVKIPRQALIDGQLVDLARKKELLNNFEGAERKLIEDYVSTVESRILNEEAPQLDSMQTLEEVAKQNGLVTARDLETFVENYYQSLTLGPEGNEVQLTPEQVQKKQELLDSLRSQFLLDDASKIKDVIRQASGSLSPDLNFALDAYSSQFINHSVNTGQAIKVMDAIRSGDLAKIQEALEPFNFEMKARERVATDHMRIKKMMERYTEAYASKGKTDYERSVLKVKALQTKEGRKISQVLFDLEKASKATGPAGIIDIQSGLISLANSNLIDSNEINTLIGQLDPIVKTTRESAADELSKRLSWHPEKSELQMAMNEGISGLARFILKDGISEQDLQVIGEMFYPSQHIDDLKASLQKTIKLHPNLEEQFNSLAQKYGKEAGWLILLLLIGGGKFGFDQGLGATQGGR